MTQLFAEGSIHNPAAAAVEGLAAFLARAVVRLIDAAEPDQADGG